MNDQLISLYIDDELNLQEKVEFVENVRDHREFAKESIKLLEQEKLLADHPQPLIEMKEGGSIPTFQGFLLRLLRPAATGAVAMAIVALIAVFVFFRDGGDNLVPMDLEEHRFVLYSPEKPQLNIIGTFTDWQPVPMKRVGSTGYWSLTLKIPQGEHRYSFIAGNGEKMADPTILTRESDDFGGVNSIIVIGEKNGPLS